MNLAKVMPDYIAFTSVWKVTCLLQMMLNELRFFPEIKTNLNKVFSGANKELISFFFRIQKNDLSK